VVDGGLVVGAAVTVVQEGLIRTRRS
jgi:hypothetical protein